MIRNVFATPIIAACLLLGSIVTAQAADPITVDTFKGETATVNSYIFSNGQSQIVMDVQRSTSEAKKLATVIKSKGLPLTHILISHGHPDHYIGMSLLMKEFPGVKIVVANQDIKKDIIGFSTWMESVGWLDNEPALKPKSKKNPDGFDYENNITALSDDSLEFNEGGTLKFDTQYKPAEAEHVTTVFVEDLNGLFTSDLGYNKVHLWMGQGVTDQHIQNWKDQLTQFQKAYLDPSLTVYPGHGDSTDITLFPAMIEYIDNFQRIIKKANSREEAMSEMEKLYPNYKEADFLLKNSVDFHVKE